MIAADSRPVRAEEEELPELEEFNQVLERYRTEHRRGPSVLMDDDRRIEIPPSLFAVLCDAVDVLLAGGAVSIMPYHAELTTQEAADYLGVSRPYLIRLLEDEGAIPYHMVGTHRRIRLSDLERYRQQRDATRRAALEQMTREAYEAGEYAVSSHEQV